MKARIRLLLLLLITLSVFYGTRAPPAHAAASSPTSLPSPNCISNGLLSAEVRNVTEASEVGRFTFARGACPIVDDTSNPDLILFPLTSFNGTSFNTVRVWDTDTDYTEGTQLGLSTNAPFSIVNLDSQSPALQAATSTLVSIAWTTSTSRLNIAQDIEIQGTTATDSRIRLTLSIHNGDTTNHMVSMRNLLDGFIGDYDGVWIRLFSGTTPGPITGVETDFTSPYSFTSYQMSGCSSNPCIPANFGAGTFSLFGSISSPPDATVPNRFVYGQWGPMFDTSFNYTSVPGRQIGSTTRNVGGTMDDGLLYFFGPVTLAPGQTTSATIFLSNQAPAIQSPPISQLSVSKFFTRGQAVDNLLPVDSNGNPKVDVVLSSGIVRSINPGEIRAWVNVTNTTPDPLQSVSLTETLPVDWLVHPPFLPGRGAIHVLFVDSQDGSVRQLNHSLTVTVSSTNPEMVTVSIPDLTSTAAGHPLMPGDSVLLSVKLDYGLMGTSQDVGSYPRDYTDTATASGFTLPLFGGTESTGSAQGLFVAYAKAEGNQGND
jgi:hypothetical protein